MKFLFAILVVLTSFCVRSQDSIDVLHYRFELSLADASDSLLGTARIRWRALKDISSADFHLAGGQPGKGMKVQSVSLVNSATDTTFRVAGFFHYDDRLMVSLPGGLARGDSAVVIIRYGGIPGDGLIISRNKYGKRTFFADNWPDRARQWLPCVDVPGDKAPVEFIVTAPSHYQVVSNGVMVDRSLVSTGFTRTHWREDVPLATKIMVIGVADFAVDTAGVVDGIPVTSWVFPENKRDGFYDYAQAKDVLAFFVKYIGAYPYQKLANVQSKTVFGGMENAGAIFYYENSINGKREEEPLLAHEIAHQWFGDMVTEKDYAHVWLSEGFATYMKHVYLENAYGPKRLAKELAADREKVIQFNRQTALPIVDSVSPLLARLNANSYQKGGWFLHMVRRQVGDTVFKKIIRQFYRSYAGKNAVTMDFQQVCELVSGKPMQEFFYQWLYRPGLPGIDARWSYDAASRKLRVTVEQRQDSLFTFPLELGITDRAGRQLVKVADIRDRKHSFEWNMPDMPVKVTLDPQTSVLYEGSIRRE